MISALYYQIYQKRQEEGKAKLEQSLDEVLPEMLNSTGQSGDTSPPQGDASPPQGDTSPQQEISADSQSLSHPYTDSDDVSFSDPQVISVKCFDFDFWAGIDAVVSEHLKRSAMLHALSVSGFCFLWSDNGYWYECETSQWTEYYKRTCQSAGTSYFC